MSLTIELTPIMESQLEREARANGVTVEAEAQKLLDKALRHQGNLRMIATIDSFMEEDGDEQAETWGYLEKALAESRRASRYKVAFGSSERNDNYGC